MSDWRDDLPPIPSDEIRRDVIREGSRRRERRRQRQRAVLLSGLGVAAVAALVVAGAAIGRDDEARDESDAAATSAAAGTRPITRPLRTEVPEATEAPAAGEGAEGTEVETAGTQEASGGTDQAGGATTVSAPEVFEVMVIPSEIWEQPASGPACGPTTIDVTFQPQSRTLQAPIVHWRISRTTGESPMVIVGSVARATIGPFGTDTLEVSPTRPVVLYVTDSDAAGVLQRFRAPTVVLHDCPL